MDWTGLDKCCKPVRVVLIRIIKTNNSQAGLLARPCEKLAYCSAHRSAALARPQGLGLACPDMFSARGSPRLLRLAMYRRVLEQTEAPKTSKPSKNPAERSRTQ